MQHDRATQREQRLRADNADLADANRRLRRQVERLSGARDVDTSDVGRLTRLHAELEWALGYGWQRDVPAVALQEAIESAQRQVRRLLDMAEREDDRGVV